MWFNGWIIYTPPHPHIKMIKNLKIRAISYNCEDLTCRIFCLILITECYEHQKNLVCPQMLAVYIMEPKICWGLGRLYIINILCLGVLVFVYIQQTSKQRDRARILSGTWHQNWRKKILANSWNLFLCQFEKKNPPKFENHLKWQTFRATVKI